MNIINIDNSSDSGISSFRITGCYEEIKNNNRLLAYLRRVRATSDDQAFAIPYVEGLKVSILQGIRQVFEKHNFTCEISPELERDLEHYFRELKQFNKFSLLIIYALVVKIIKIILIGVVKIV